MVRYTVGLIVLVIAVVLVIQPISPIHPAYVTSDSMEPTLEEGDLYFIVETTDVEPGDIITFRSTRRNGFVTHRVVDRTGNGMITKGDNNPTTDQAAGFRPIKRSQIVGTVLTIKGEPLTVSNAGQTLAATDPYRLPLLILVLTALFISELQSDSPDTGRMQRDVVYVRDIVLPVLLGGLLISFAAISFAATNKELTYVVAQGDTTAPHTLPPDEPAVRNVTVHVRHPPLTTTIVEAEGVTVVNQSINGSRVDLTIRFEKPESLGPKLVRVHVYSYPAVLPASVLERLQKIHWLVASAASIAVVFLPLLILYGLFLDGGEPLHRTRLRWFGRLGGE